MNKNHNALRHRYEQVQREIDETCAQFNRLRSDIHLLAVSKGQSKENIQALYELGQRDFGENYALELQEKKEALKELCPEIRWHFLGAIQSNKAKLIAQCNMVHSVGSVPEAQSLEKYRLKDPLPIFLQVNCAKEPKRHGFDVSDLPKAIEQIAASSKLKIKGLMMIAPQIEPIAPARWFKMMRDILGQLQKDLHVTFGDLSMGMSSDYKEAVEYGATWIRLGTSLFGPRRSPADSARGAP